ncbi:MAG TPA: recombinase family protein [Caulobacteraceae bacterium]|nr:recombinase family protein [Caulobacteraceae bacterium]
MTTMDLYDTAPPAPAGGRAAALKGRMQAAASAVLLPALRRVAGDLIGGESLDEAWAVAQRLEAQGLAHTLGFWDTPDYGPDQVVAIYRDSIARAAQSDLDAYVSIKPPALHYDRGVARDLAAAAAAAGVRLHCDSHALAVQDLTLAFADDLAARLGPGRVSVSLPGRWARSVMDAARLLDHGIGVRVVKGQWPDPTDPARDVRDGFLDLAASLAGRTGPIALASHDAALLAAAAEPLVAAGTAFELEFIHGLQTPALLALAESCGVRARLYVPFGRGFVPSALGVLKRNPRLALSALKAMLAR